MTGGYDIEDLWRSPQSEKAPERVVIFSFLFGVHRLERAAAPIAPSGGSTSEMKRKWDVAWKEEKNRD